MSDPQIDTKLLSIRKELLDIGLRNNMLNFRQTTKQLRVVDELSEEILNTLYQQAKPMIFAADSPKQALLPNRSDPAGKDNQTQAATSQPVEKLADVEPPTRPDPRPSSRGTAEQTRRQRVENRLQTKLSEEGLFQTLLKIHTEAELFLQERGANTLFLALGFLHWREAASSSKECIAPLLLVPVTLKRRPNKDVFQLEYNGDDLVQNLSLAARLKTDFGLELPQYGVDQSVDAEEMPPLKIFFEAVQACIHRQTNWFVDPNEIFLGFFSFSKFLMFNDLDPAIWPASKQPADHPILRRLLNQEMGNELSAYAEDVHIDTVPTAGMLRFVKDADSSQTQAILEVQAGRNLIIQGPPGTGKSQTITNIVAECLAQNKTVLFVAEKMAALEVVKRRLDETRLGDAVLELHSHRATKQSVLKELTRTLDQEPPKSPDDLGDRNLLVQMQEQLNNYCQAVNQPIMQSRQSFVSALGHYQQLRREYPQLKTLNFEPLKEWSHTEYTQYRGLAEELAKQQQELDIPSTHLFWRTTLESFSPLENEKISGLLDQGANRLRRVAEIAAQLAETVGLTHLVALADVPVISGVARRALEAPVLDGILITAPEWRRQRASIHELIVAGQTMALLRVRYAHLSIELVDSSDLLAIRQHLNQGKETWLRTFSVKYHRARNQLQRLYKIDLPKNDQDCIDLIDDLLQFQQQKKIYDRFAALGSALFAMHWNQEHSDWALLSRLNDWIGGLYDDLTQTDIPHAVLDFLAHPSSSDIAQLTTWIETAEQEYVEIDKILTKILQQLHLSQSYPMDQMTGQPLQSLQMLLVDWQAQLNRLYPLIRFKQLSQKLAQAGLNDLVRDAENGFVSGNDIVHVLDLTWYGGLVNFAYNNIDVIRRFDRIQQHLTLDRFRTLDLRSLENAQAELAHIVQKRISQSTSNKEMELLHRELNKKRRQISIRQLMKGAGRAIQQIKPVFMMSPMSIANFLPPGQLEFDIVIFDEASQVKAVDALGALLRGRQIVVVGDTRQMPPSDFFSREIETEEEEITTDIDSILNLFCASGCRERYLRWHYRSRHESLIAVSNAEFYNHRLVIFPSAGTNPQATGLKFHHLPDAVYDRGKTRTNLQEARAIAQAVNAHAEKHPDLSLGVVAFSVAQRDLIQMEVEKLRRHNNAFEEFMTKLNAKEPFFVKNLENVQGDERDVILISIGYGRDEHGRIAKDFGPINRSGGERRLNVLITRAKLSMEVFCNFRAEDLDLDATAKHGAHALKNFLHYAEKRILPTTKQTGNPPDSVFEQEVLVALAERGYQLEPQVGAAGYFIDIAVKDPEHPGRYVLAIECDGANYHSARSARDRDRLRQGVLESLGWKFHRIWSTDWFRNPDKEIERAIVAIEEARKNLPTYLTDAPSTTALTPLSPLQDVGQPPATSAHAVAPYRKAQLIVGSTQHQELHLISPLLLAQQIKQIVEIEAPVHESEMTRRLLECYGVNRSGHRIAATIAEAVQVGTAKGLFYALNGFLYVDQRRNAKVRSRAELNPTERKIEWVAPEEIDEAILDVVRIGLSHPMEDAITDAAERLGFGRITNKMKEIIRVRLDLLLVDRQLIQKDTMLYLPEPPHPQFAAQRPM